MGIRATLSRLTRRTTVLLAVVPTVLAIAQPLEAHAAPLYTWAAVDGDCTMTVTYDIGDPKTTAQTTLATPGMSCTTPAQSLAYTMYDWAANVAGVAVPVLALDSFGAVCATGRQSSVNVFSVSSLPGSSCSAAEMPGVHLIEVDMQIEVATDQYVDTQTFMDVAVP